MPGNSTTKLTVKVETSGAPWVGIGLDGTMLPNVGGAFAVAFGKRHVLFFQVSGDPGTAYKITLTPAAGSLVIGAKHPIEEKIAATETMGGGHVFFSVKEG